jgi:hypothetical protein
MPAALYRSSIIGPSERVPHRFNYCLYPSVVALVETYDARLFDGKARPHELAQGLTPIGDKMRIPDASLTGENASVSAMLTIGPSKLHPGSLFYFNNEPPA